MGVRQIERELRRECGKHHPALDAQRDQSDQREEAQAAPPFIKRIAIEHLHPVPRYPGQCSERVVEVLAVECILDAQQVARETLTGTVVPARGEAWLVERD